MVFLGEGSGNPETFADASPASAGLQQLVLIYPGFFEPLAGAAAEFQPLLTTGEVSGVLPYFQMVQRNFLGSQLNPNLPHRPDPSTYVVAAEARTFRPGSDATGAEDLSDPAEADSTRIIAIADLDFISEQFFELRRIGPANLNFDNVSFFLNAMDVLIGDESFVALRNRRVRHRTLEAVESRVRAFTEQRSRDEDDAETSAQDALRQAQERLDRRVAAVQERDDLDAQAKANHGPQPSGSGEPPVRRARSQHQRGEGRPDSRQRGADGGAGPPHSERHPHRRRAAAPDSGIPAWGLHVRKAAKGRVRGGDGSAPPAPAVGNEERER